MPLEGGYGVLGLTVSAEEWTRIVLPDGRFIHIATRKESGIDRHRLSIDAPKDIQIIREEHCGDQEFHRAG